jgi:hypothetical protein
MSHVWCQELNTDKASNKGNELQTQAKRKDYHHTKSENDTVQKVQEHHCEHPSMASFWALDGNQEILKDLLTAHHLPARIFTGVAPTLASKRAGDGDCGQRCLPTSWDREQHWSTKEIDGTRGSSGARTSLEINEEEEPPSPQWWSGCGDSKPLLHFGLPSQPNESAHFNPRF